MKQIKWYWYGVYHFLVENLIEDWSKNPQIQWRKVWDTLYIDGPCMNISLVFKIASAQTNLPQRTAK